MQHEKLNRKTREPSLHPTSIPHVPATPTLHPALHKIVEDIRDAAQTIILEYPARGVPCQQITLCNFLLCVAKMSVNKDRGEGDAGEITRDKASELHW